MELTNNRIDALDGLRAVAVLGVIWVHVWFFVPVRATWIIGPVDLNKLIGVVGTGVDLFFVISGFCLYMMYTKLIGRFTLQSYWCFMKKRWWRIAPAYYVAVVVSAIFVMEMDAKAFPAVSILKHFLFLNTIPSQANNLAPPFWSLTTEWQFYLFLPALFAFSFGSRKFLYWLASIYLCSICFRIFIFCYHPDWENAWKATIFFRLPEFIAGILVAYALQRKIVAPSVLKGFFGFVLSLLIAFAGRLLMTENSVLHFSVVKGIGRAFGEPTLTIGYALIVWNVITSDSVFAWVLKSKPFTFIGRISYSMYLWHWWLLMIVTTWVVGFFESPNLIHWISYFAFLTIFIPFSYLSYLLLEAFYFKRKQTVHV